MQTININNSEVHISTELKEDEEKGLLRSYRKHREKVLYKAKKLMSEKQFKKVFTFGRWRIYITKNLKLKNQSKTDKIRFLFDTKLYRGALYNKRGGKCEICGKHLKIHEVEMHHALPLGRFKELTLDERALMILCHDCHREIHFNPYLQIKQMEQKAKELGINLKDYYNV